MAVRQQRLDGVAFAMLVALGTLWGGAFVLNEILLTALPVLWVVALRLLLAAVTLWAVVVALRVPVPRALALWGAFALLGLLNNAVPFSLIVWGQTEITGGLAAILNATTPLFTALLAGLTLADERLTGPKLMGLAFGLIGVALIIGLDALAALEGAVAAQLAILGAAASYAVSAVFARRFGKLGVRPIVVAAGQTSASSAVMVPFAALVHGGPGLVSAGPTIWVSLVAIACLATALAYVLYFAILGRAGATNAALVTVLVPVAAIAIGAALLGETIGLLDVAGMAFITLGFLAIDGRWIERLRRR